jgi:serine/threonine protein kinase
VTTADHFIDELAPESRIGRYEIVKLLAKGGMAEIYLAKSAGMHGFEALSVLKRLPPSCLLDNPNYATLFFDEARLVASLRHPNIAQVFDFGQDEDSYYFIMEYLDGLNLRQLIRKARKRGERVPMACAIQIVLGVAAGLHAAHETKGPEGQSLNIVHRDVSPTNIVVTAEGAIKVIDFGVAKSTRHRARTETGVVKGKYAYMSPEQCQAQPIDRRTDLFALGVVLYELMTGTRPHGKGAGPELLKHICEDDAPDPRIKNLDFPDEMAEILAKLLHRDAELRYQSARELHRDLSLFAARAQIMLSPYELATWVQGLIEEPVIRRARTSREGSQPRAITRANTQTFARPSVGAPLIESEISGLSQISHHGLALGTGPLEDVPVSAMHAHPRMLSVPYEEFAIGTTDDNRVFGEEDIAEAEALDEVDAEPEADEAAEGPAKRSWVRSMAAVAGGTVLGLLCLGGIASAAIAGGHVDADLNTVVDFLSQIPG